MIIQACTLFTWSTAITTANDATTILGPFKRAVGFSLIPNRQSLEELLKMRRIRVENIGLDEV